MTFKEWMQANRPEKVLNDKWGGGVSECPFKYGLETENESRKNCYLRGGNGCKYCWNREMPEAKTPDKAGQAKAVRMPKLSTGTKLQIIAGIMAKYHENANRENQSYCDGILDAVCSVMNFEVEHE